MIEDLSDGIYFNLPMETYVALPRLGAHGLGNLLVSPATYWEGSHLNPAPREVSDSVQKTRVVGSAYHCARLELEHFNDRYAREPDKAEMPEGSLFTGADMGAELEARGCKKTGSVAEQAARLAAAGFPREQLWQMVASDFVEALGDRIPLSARVWDEIVTDGERLRQSPEVARLIDGGEAEVSILWTDERGVKCKCRPDKLHADWWVDLKTFANVGGKNLEQAISDAIRFNRYHVAASHYRDGIEAVRVGGLQIVGDATDEQRAMIAAIAIRPEELECWYVFQEKGGIPNILAKLMRFREVSVSVQAQHAGASEEAIARVEKATAQPSLWWERARREIRKAKRLFRTYSEVYAPGDPWLPFNPLGEITDLSFSAYFLDEEIGE